MLYFTKRAIFLNSMSIVFIFTIAYYITSRIEERLGLIDNYTGKKITPLSLFDAFYFTLVTQTTVGYGSLYPPSKLSQTINILQLLTVYKIVEMAIL